MESTLSLPGQKRISVRHRSRTSLARRVYLAIIGTVVAAMSVLFVLEVASGYVDDDFSLETRGQAYQRYNAGQSLRQSQDGGLLVQAPAPPTEHVGELSEASLAHWLERLRARHREVLALRDRAYESGMPSSFVTDLERMPWAQGAEVSALLHQVAGAELEERVALAQLKLRLLESGLYWTLPRKLGARELRWLHHSFAPLDLERVGEAETESGAPVFLYLAIDEDSWPPHGEAKLKLARAWDALTRAVLDRFNARPLADRRAEIRAYDSARAACAPEGPGRFAPLRQFQAEHPVFRFIRNAANIDRERNVLVMAY